MNERFLLIAYLDADRKRKWKTLTKLIEEMHEGLMACKYLIRTSGMKAPYTICDYALGDILYEDSKYVLCYSDIMIDSVRLYEKVG